MLDAERWMRGLREDATGGGKEIQTEGGMIRRKTRW